VSKKTDEDEFRLRPNRAPKGGKGEARAWSTALKTVMRYAGTSRRSGRNGRGSTQGSGGSFRQRCAVRIMYSANKTPGQWRAHGRYLSRESAGTPAFGALGPSSGLSRATVDAGETLGRWQSEGDPRLWKIIISPEFGDRVDLDELTRQLMTRMEKDLGTRLEWVAVIHRNTEHPHVHVALRGVGSDRSPLHLERDYVRNGVRAIAEDLCTRQLGYRTQADAVAAERREIDERRFTSLDRIIARRGSDSFENWDSATHFVINLEPDLRRVREQNISARLIVLRAMGLAEQHGPAEWHVRRDFETVLRAMQRTTDRQKMLAAHGALLSDERLPFSVLDLRKLKVVEGRVLAHGEEESGRGAGRHYALIEGTDAQVHLIYYTPEMEQARNQGKLRTNSFVRLQKVFENGRPLIEITDEGDAEKLLKNRHHFTERALSFRGREHQIAAEDFGGWLGRYRSALASAIDREGQLRQRTSTKARSEHDR
jgi:type IV secretory pathway VirD2 relaxase